MVRPMPHSYTVNLSPAYAGSVPEANLFTRLKPGAMDLEPPSAAKMSKVQGRAQRAPTAMFRRRT
jgi:hypothetical protein